MINMRAYRGLGLAAIAVVVTTQAAQAAPPEASSAVTADRPFDVDGATTLRFQLPLSQVVVWPRGTGRSNDGGFAVFGASVAQRFRNIIEAEVGGAIIVNPCGSGTQGTLRLGLSPSLSTPRPGGTHWNVRLPVLASAHAASLGGDGCDGRTDSRGKAFDVAAGIDATRWSQGGNGFNMRLLVGYGLDGLTEATLALGVAF